MLRVGVGGVLQVLLSLPGFTRAAAGGDASDLPLVAPTADDWAASWREAETLLTFTARRNIGCDPNSNGGCAAGTMVDVAVDVQAGVRLPDAGLSANSAVLQLAIEAQAGTVLPASIEQSPAVGAANVPRVAFAPRIAGGPARAALVLRAPVALRQGDAAYVLFDGFGLAQMAPTAPVVLRDQRNLQWEATLRPAAGDAGVNVTLELQGSSVEEGWEVSLTLPDTLGLLLPASGVGSGRTASVAVAFTAAAADGGAVPMATFRQIDPVGYFGPATALAFTGPGGGRPAAGAPATIAFTILSEADIAAGEWVRLHLPDFGGTAITSATATSEPAGYIVECDWDPAAGHLTFRAAIDIPSGMGLTAIAPESVGVELPLGGVDGRDSGTSSVRGPEFDTAALAGPIDATPIARVQGVGALLRADVSFPCAAVAASRSCAGNTTATLSFAARNQLRNGDLVVLFARELLSPAAAEPLSVYSTPQGVFAVVSWRRAAASTASSCGWELVLVVSGGVAGGETVNATIGPLLLSLAGVPAGASLSISVDSPLSPVAETPAIVLTPFPPAVINATLRLSSAGAAVGAGTAPLSGGEPVALEVEFILGSSLLPTLVPAVVLCLPGFGPHSAFTISPLPPGCPSDIPHRGCSWVANGAAAAAAAAAADAAKYGREQPVQSSAGFETATWDPAAQRLILFAPGAGTVASGLRVLIIISAELGLTLPRDGLPSDVAAASAPTIALSASGREDLPRAFSSVDYATAANSGGGGRDSGAIQPAVSGAVVEYEPLLAGAPVVSLSVALRLAAGLPAGGAVRLYLLGLTLPPGGVRATGVRVAPAADIVWDPRVSALTATFTLDLPPGAALQVTIPSTMGIGLPAAGIAGDGDGPMYELLSVGSDSDGGDLQEEMGSGPRRELPPAVATGVFVTLAAEYQPRVPGKVSKVAVEYALSAPLAVGDAVAVRLQGFWLAAAGPVNLTALVEVTEADVQSNCSADTTPSRALAPLNPAGTSKCAVFASSDKTTTYTKGPGAAVCLACEPGLFGPACSAECTDDGTCRGRGFCNAGGRCVCFHPFTGPTCDADTSAAIAATAAATGISPIFAAAVSCATDDDPAAAVLQPVGYRAGRLAVATARGVAAGTAARRMATVVWDGDTLTMTIGSALPAWRLVRITLPTSAGVRLPVDGIPVATAAGTLNATVRAAAAVISVGGPAAVAPLARLRCERVAVRVPDGLLCSGPATVRVCAFTAAAAAEFASTIALPKLTATSSCTSGGVGGQCAAAARSCCGAGVGAGDFAQCATDEDCAFDASVAAAAAGGGSVNGGAGVPVANMSQCCAECERLTSCSTGDDNAAAAERVATACQASGCAAEPPCAGHPVTSAAGPSAAAGSPATVVLATGAGLRIPVGVWPSSEPATVEGYVGNLPPAPGGDAVQVSEVLFFGPSGLNFSEPGITLVFALDAVAAVPQQGFKLRVFRLNPYSAKWVLHPFDPVLQPPSAFGVPALLLVKTLSFSAYGVFLVPVAPLPPPQENSTLPLINATTSTPLPGGTPSASSGGGSGGTSTMVWVAIGAGVGGAVLALVFLVFLVHQLYCGTGGGKQKVVAAAGFRSRRTKEPLSGLLELPPPHDSSCSEIVQELTSLPGVPGSATGAEMVHDKTVVGELVLPKQSAAAAAAFAALAEADLAESEPAMADLQASQQPLNDGISSKVVPVKGTISNFGVRHQPSTATGGAAANLVQGEPRGGWLIPPRQSAAAAAAAAALAEADLAESDPAIANLQAAPLLDGPIAKAPAIALISATGAPVAYPSTEAAPAVMDLKEIEQAMAESRVPVAPSPTQGTHAEEKVCSSSQPPEQARLSLLPMTAPQISAALSAVRSAAAARPAPGPLLFESPTTLVAPTTAAARAGGAGNVGDCGTGLVVSRMEGAAASADVIVMEAFRRGDSEEEGTKREGRVAERTPAPRTKSPAATRTARKPPPTHAAEWAGASAGEILSLTVGDKNGQRKRFTAQTMTKPPATGMLSKEEAVTFSRAIVEGGEQATPSGPTASVQRPMPLLLVKPAFSTGGDALNEVEPVPQQMLNNAAANHSDGVDKKSEQQETAAAATAAAPPNVATSAGVCEASQQLSPISAFAAASIVDMNLRKSQQLPALDAMSKPPVPLNAAAAAANKSIGLCEEENEPPLPPTAAITTAISWDESEPQPLTAAPGASRSMGVCKEENEPPLPPTAAIATAISWDEGEPLPLIAAATTTATYPTAATATTASALVKRPLEDAVVPAPTQAPGSRLSSFPAAAAAVDFDVSEFLLEHKKLYSGGGLGGSGSNGVGEKGARAGPAAGPGTGPGTVLAESSQAQVL